MKMTGSALARFRRRGKLIWKKPLTLTSSTPCADVHCPQKPTSSTETNVLKIPSGLLKRSDTARTFCDSLTTTATSANCAKSGGFDAILDNRSETESTSSGGDSSVYSSSVYGGEFITPIPHRATKSSPPLAILDGVGMTSKRNTPYKLLPWKRRKGLASPSSSTIQIRSPYQSKSALRSLSASLRSCNDLKHGSLGSNSAWRRPISTYMVHDVAFSMPNRPLQIDDQQFEWDASNSPSAVEMDIIVSTSSSDSSLLLPNVISPAYKFIPIGCEDEDNLPFAESDYDICKEEMEEERAPLSASDKSDAQSSPDDKRYKVAIICESSEKARNHDDSFNAKSAPNGEPTPFEEDLMSKSKETTERGRASDSDSSCTPFELHERSLSMESILSRTSTDSATADNKKEKQNFNWWPVLDQLTSVINCSQA